MTYLKTLIALTTLALLTACAGGVAVNNTFNSGPTALTCTQNPFGTTCTAPTPTEAEVFCSDASKPTTTKANDCAPTVIRVCGENPYDAGLCIDNNDYTNARQRIRLTCTNDDTTGRDPLCPVAVATECTADPFLDVCRLGTAGADDGTYGLERTKQIDATCPNNVHDEICHNVAPYEGQRQQILSNCEANVGTGNACPANVVRDVCIGNPYNTVLCNDPAIDYTTQRMERLEACKGNNGLDGCAAAAATTCPTNPFQAGICFIGTTYMSQRDSETLNCRNGVTDAPNCPDAQTAVCTLNSFDAFCKDVALFIGAQIDGCADATATTAQCNVLFATAFAGCLQDPFSDTCDTEATFTASRDSVRTSRFGYCETDQTNDARCAGYRACNDPLTFAPATCGADFQPARLAYCKSSTANLFGTDCETDTFTQARVEFCMATPNNDDCRADLRGESLMSVPDPCEGGLITAECTVEIADLPTYPATPNATTTNEFLAITATTASTLTEGLVPTTLFITESTTNGMAFFTENDAYYAGILAGTNLGAPISDTTTTALKWQGDFRAVAGIAEAVVGADNGDDFELDITFDGDEGTMKTFFNVGGTGFYYSIDGTFDDKGVISGDILFGTIVGVRENRQIFTDHENYSPGTLTGLIGQNGAVGAFISGHETLVAGSSAISYSGGFFATPPAPPPPPDPCIAAGDCVEFADWTASFASGGDNESTTSPLRDSGFTNAVRGTSDYIRLDGDNKIVTSAGTFTPSILRLNETVNQDGYESGFAYVNISITGFVGQTYVGMLPTTNLGAPLINTDKNATWTGKLAGQTGFATPPLDIGSFSLKITFGGTSSEAGSVGTITTLDGDGDPGFTSVNGNEGDANGVRFIGDFNAAGVMWGSVNLHGADADNGTFNGLIGVKGAIGVFEGAISSYSYAGGFAVAPPSSP